MKTIWSFFCYNEVGDNMNIKKIKEIVKNKLAHEASGHDYLHALRVLENTKKLITDQVDKDVVYTAALIHDLIDHKLEEEYTYSLEDLALLLKDELSSTQIEKVLDIIENISFSKGKVPKSLEGKIVQDADRLDAIGAIGIARCFSYGGKNERLIYNPDSKDGTDSVSHFYQKLFTLHTLMNTKRGKEEALKRTEFMKEYIMKLDEEIGGF